MGPLWGRAEELRGAHAAAAIEHYKTDHPRRDDSKSGHVSVCLSESLILSRRDLTGEKHFRMEDSDLSNDTEYDHRRDHRKNKCLDPPSHFFALQPDRTCDARELRLLRGRGDTESPSLRTAAAPLACKSSAVERNSPRDALTPLFRLPRHRGGRRAGKAQCPDCVPPPAVCLPFHKLTGNPFRLLLAPGFAGALGRTRPR